MTGPNEAAALAAIKRIEERYKPVPPEVVAAMEQVVDDAVQDAKALVPVDTGKLRDSIQGEVSGGGDVVTGEIIASTRYALYVEHGTKVMRARPFLRPAANRAGANSPKKLTTHIRRALEGR